MSAHRTDWIQTYTGKAFWPLEPRVEDIDVRDIAHALSLLCRYGGHVRRFYSVAEHCVLLSHTAPAEFAFEALMHDASEAYLVDVPRPLKAELAGYREAEERLERVIADRFGLAYPWPAVVTDMDRRILTDERSQLMATAPMPWGTDAEPLKVRCIGFDPLRAETDFLRRFEVLAAARAVA